MIERGYVLRLTDEDANAMLGHHLRDELILPPIGDRGYVELRLEDFEGAYMLEVCVVDNPFLGIADKRLIEPDKWLVNYLTYLFNSSN